jgi:hypothetical protein
MTVKLAVITKHIESTQLHLNEIDEELFEIVKQINDIYIRDESLEHEEFFNHLKYDVGFFKIKNEEKCYIEVGHIIKAIKDLSLQYPISCEEILSYFENNRYQEVDIKNPKQPISKDREVRFSDKEAMMVVRDMLAKSLRNVPPAEVILAHRRTMERAIKLLDNQLGKAPFTEENISINNTVHVDLKPFEENLRTFGYYNKRQDKTENAIQFLERAWGKYLNRFNGGQGDYIYQDQLRKLDTGLINGINNWRRGKPVEVSDFIPEKCARVKKEYNELLQAVESTSGDLSMKQKLYRLQRVSSS